MAGLQFYMRNVTYNLRPLSKSGILQQSNRRRHLLAFHIPSSINTQFLKKLQPIIQLDLNFVYRLASTNVVSDSLGNSQPPLSDIASGSKTGETLEAFNKTIPGTSTGSSEIPVPSKSNVVIDESLLPPAPSDVPVIEQVISDLKEPAFEALGLGSWYPPGIIQKILEFLHIQFDLPWWAAITIVTVAVRVLVFPLYVSTKKASIRLSNNLPEFSALQLKMIQARQARNAFDVALISHEMSEFMKEKKISLLDSFKPAFIQMPIFISMYRALNAMAEAPVESMKEGGLFWFRDLTTYDPYYIIPVLNAGILYLMLEKGGEGVNTQALQNHILKYVMRGIPFIILPLTMHWSSALFCYWTISNVISISSLHLFKITAVKNYFKIPEVIPYTPPTPTNPSNKKMGFFSGFRESMENMKIAKELEERERLNLQMIEKAGKSPIQRTFKRNPLKAQKAADASASGK